MRPTTWEILRVTSSMGDRWVSLADLSGRAHRSAWSLHRLFRAVTGEPPGRFARRVALDRAAARLVTDGTPVASLAFDAGFDSHEGFSRAFTRRFGIAPRAYRTRGLAGAATRGMVRDHRRVVETTSPCVHLYRLDDGRKGDRMTATVEVREVPGFSALVVRRRTSRQAIAETLAECLPLVFDHAQRHGSTLVSPPFCRYVEVGVGTMLVECGFAVADGAGADVAGDIELVQVPPGRGAVAVHRGPYESLVETYAAIELWLDEHAIEPAGPAWETYLTDPAHHPDPADWRTEITQPIAR